MQHAVLQPPFQKVGSPPDLSSQTEPCVIDPILGHRYITAAVQNAHIALAEAVCHASSLVPDESEKLNALQLALFALGNLARPLGLQPLQPCVPVGLVAHHALAATVNQLGVVKTTLHHAIAMASRLGNTSLVARLQTAKHIFAQAAQPYMMEHDLKMLENPSLSCH